MQGSTSIPGSKRQRGTLRSGGIVPGRRCGRRSQNQAVTSIAIGLLVCLTAIATCAQDRPAPRMAGLATVYYPNAHADMFLSRMLTGYTLDGQGEFPPWKLASLHVEQFPDNDMSRKLAAAHGVPMFAMPRQALTLGGDKLAVDGVFLICEHGKYPESDTGQFLYPKRAMFAQIVAEFERSGRVVPVFLDKHLADNWRDAKWIYDEAQRLKIPLMAGSSLPVLWRYPPRDVQRDAALREVLVLSYHRLDSYGFHALEIGQALAERRRGGETGVKSVRTLKDDAVWRAIDEGVVDAKLLELATAQAKDRPICKDKKLSELIKHPHLFVIDYRDGLRVNVLTLDQLYIDWTAAWSYTDGRRDAAVFWTQEARPFMHFTYLMKPLEPFFRDGTRPWPVQRTLLTTGLLDALLVSNRDGGRVVDTPHLNIEYRTDWNWSQPPPPPPDRPINGQ